MIEEESVLAFFINFKFCLSSSRAVKPLARLEGAKRLEKRGGVGVFASFRQMK